LNETAAITVADAAPDICTAAESKELLGGPREQRITTLGLERRSSFAMIK
jgi:hypothetical protein